MANLYLPSPNELSLPSRRNDGEERNSVDELLLIVGRDDLSIADYVVHARKPGRRLAIVSESNVLEKVKSCGKGYDREELSTTEFLLAHRGERSITIVIFLPKHDTKRNRIFFEKVAEIIVQKQVECVCIVSSFRVHFGDLRASRVENWILNRLQNSSARIVVFRPGHILSPQSHINRRLRRYRILASATPTWLTTCCVDGEELFSAIETELTNKCGRRRRTYTLLGENTSWKALLARTQFNHPSQLAGKFVGIILRFCLLGQLFGLVLNLIVKCFPSFRYWNVKTLCPKSTQELLALYNKYNYKYVKIVGYNNGVVHFGHRYPGKTIVSTVNCNRIARVEGNRVRLDGGVTIRQAMKVLVEKNKEFYVLPNYSYVSLGTSYFIPIHGSANKYTTLGETIERVLLYDPIEDQFVAASKKCPAFGRYMYNLNTEVLLLRLTLRIKNKSHYFIEESNLTNPSSHELLRYFHDDRASNVEIRKADASSEEVKVSQYYTEVSEGHSAALELPRDTLGSLWDRLEANPITSILFHGLVRRFAHHVELFLSEDEFAVFWDTHHTLPVKKIQLRYIKRDGLPHSPFRDHDCISADLFMLKKHRDQFDVYLKTTLPGARSNPGKHSR